MSDGLREQLSRAGAVFPDDELAALALAFSGAELAAAVERRCQGALIQHLVGHADFSGLELVITAPVFVPRPRAAALVRVADRLLARLAPDASSPALRVVDLGCGCGALAAALAATTVNVVRAGRRAVRVLAVDTDPTAVDCAARNGTRYGFTAVRGDWLTALPPGWEQLDLVLAYLPHMPDHELERRPRDLAAVEPLATVSGGPDGLGPLRAVLPQVARRLVPDGTFLTLVQEEQLDAAAAAVTEVGLSWGAEVGDERGDLVLVVTRPAADLRGPLSGQG